MDERTNRAEPGGQPQPSVPDSTIVPLQDSWAAGVSPVTISPRSRRFRWGVAGAVVVIVALATTAGAFVLSGAAGARSLTASLAPKNSIFFMEVRTDLPGDQHAKLADFLSPFPGFKDRSQFDNALDELLNMLTGRVSPDLRYTSAFKPWMEGEVSIAVTSLGAGAATTPMPCGGFLREMSSSYPPLVLPSFDPNTFSFDPGIGGMNLSMPPSSTYGSSIPNAVAIFALKDRAAAETWVSGEVGRLNLTTKAQDYAGTRIYTTDAGVAQGAYAFTDQDLVLGTVDGVKAALDTRTKGSLADNPNYQAAMKSASADSLARFYLDLGTVARTAVDSASAMMCWLAASPGATFPPTFDPGKAPAWLAGSLRAEADHMVLEMAMPPTGMQRLGNHNSRIASSLPATTVGVDELHSVGQTIQTGLSAVESQGPTLGLDVSSIKSVKDALTVIGGIDWLGDGAIVVTRDGSTYDGGIVAEAPDAKTAQSKVGLISGLVTLSGGSTGLKIRDETYKGDTIVIVTVPANTGGLGNAPVQLAIGTKGNLIVVGYTDAFVKAVIDTTVGTSLAAQADYTAAMGAAGASNQGSIYVNVPALEEQVGAAFSPDPSRWTLNYKPYVDHVGGFAYSAIDGNTVIVRLVVMAR